MVTSRVAAPQGNALVRRWQRSYATRLFFTDLFFIALAVFGSQILRFGVSAPELGFAVLSGAVALDYTMVSLAIIALWMVSLDYHSTRDRRMIGTGTIEYKRVADATLRLFGLLAILAFVFQWQIARGYLLIALPAGLALLLLSRWWWRHWLIRRRRTGGFMHRAILVGDRTKSEHVASQMLRDSGAGFAIVGAVTHRGSHHPLADGTEVLGDFSHVAQAVDAVGADTVIVTGADTLDPRSLREMGWSLGERSVDVIVAPALTDVAGPRIHARPVAGLPLIQVDYPELEGSRFIAKRAFDVVMSGILLVLLSPVFLAISIAVRRDSAGPALFRQRRVGLNGTPFDMLKFRSMVMNADEILPSLLDQSEGNGVLFKLKADPRVTKVGSFLRRYSLDELPQFVNVFLGEMSLVGPRPPLKREVEKYDAWAQRRLLVKPGITGLWQTQGRSNLSWEDSIRLDLYYVENWSLTGDIVILYRTVRAVAKADGAY